MDNEQVYEEETGGLTFKKIGRFFKKGWLTMLVCAAAVVIITMAIALPLKYFYKSAPSAQMSIELKYPNIERGLDPDGGILNTDNMISANVLNKAISRANLGDKITDVSALSNVLRVEAVPTDAYVKLVADAKKGSEAAQAELRNYVMYPTKFNIVLSDVKKLGLDNGEATTLLDEIYVAYCESFVEDYADPLPFEKYIYDYSSKPNFDYVDIYDIYSSRLETLSSYMSSFAANLPKSAAQSFKNKVNNVRNDITVLGMSYEKFNKYILANSIWMDKEEALISLQTQYDSYKGQKEAKEAYRDSLKAQLDVFKANTTSTPGEGGPTITVTYPEEYFEYLEKLDTANRQIEYYTVHMKNLEEHMKKIGSETGSASQELIDNADAMLLDIEAESTRVMSELVSLIDDYNDTIFVSYSVSKVQPAVVTRNGLKFSLWIVLIVAGLAGIIVGAIVAGIFVARDSAKEKAAAKADNADTAESK